MLGNTTVYMSVGILKGGKTSVLRFSVTEFLCCLVLLRSFFCPSHFIYLYYYIYLMVLYLCLQICDSFIWRPIKRQICLDFIHYIILSSLTTWIWIWKPALKLQKGSLILYPFLFLGVIFPAPFEFYFLFLLLSYNYFWCRQCIRERTRESCLRTEQNRTAFNGEREREFSLF